MKDKQISEGTLFDELDAETVEKPFSIVNA